MKITYVILSLAGGGAERVMSIVSKEAVERGHEVTIITCLPICAYTIDKSITVKSCFTDKEIQNNLISKVRYKSLFFFRLFKFLKKEKPDVVISFMKGVNKHSIIASKILNIPVIASEHTNYQQMNFLQWFERRWVYKLASAVTVLTNYDSKNYYSKFLSKVIVLPNPNSFSSINKIGIRDKSIIIVGSLDRYIYKGFDSFLHVFSKIVRKYPDWVLKIAGSGDIGKKELEKIVKKLNLENSVTFLGFCPDLSLELKKSSIYVLSSQFEGFSMSLAESMSQGCACISYDCIAGPSEIISNGIDGILVEDQNQYQLFDEISMLIEDEQRQKYLALNAIKNIQRFSLENIGNKWDFLIHEVVVNKGNKI